MNENDRRNLNPTPEGIAAMWIFHDEYAAQGGGTMDFWKELSKYKKKLVHEFLQALDKAKEKA